MGKLQRVSEKRRFNPPNPLEKGELGVKVPLLGALHCQLDGSPEATFVGEASPTKLAPQWGTRTVRASAF